MKKLNLFLVAIFMIAFVGCQMNSETPLELTNNGGEQTTPEYPYVENDEHEHNWVELVLTSRSVIGESSPMKCSLCGTVCVHKIEHTDKPTCTESVLLKCKCGEVTRNENALGHDFGDNLEKCNRCGIVNPNYVEQPPQTYTCNGCNTVYNTETEKDNCNKQNGCPKYVEQHKHNFVKVSDATCTEPSTEKCECSEETHNVDALGHTFGKDDTTTEKCSRCDTVNGNYVPTLSVSYEFDGIYFNINGFTIVNKDRLTAAKKFEYIYYIFYNDKGNNFFIYYNENTQVCKAVYFKDTYTVLSDGGEVIILDKITRQRFVI